MEKKVRKETSWCMGNINPINIPAGGGGGIGMHKHSQTISKMKPKIRIIHIFTPEIIKTDVANFRDLVQRLTGKPSPLNYTNNINPPPPPPPPTTTISSASTETAHHRFPDKPRMSMKMDLFRKNRFWGLNDESKDQRVKEQDGGGLCNAQNSSGGYLGGFSDLEGFISEFGDFPLLPVDHATHYIMQEPLLS